MLTTKQSNTNGERPEIPPFRLGFIRDETRAQAREKAHQRLMDFQTLDVIELYAMVEHYILRWDKSFGRYDSRTSKDVTETEHCLVSLVALEMRINELGADALMRLRFGEVTSVESERQSELEPGDASSIPDRDGGRDYTIGYLSEGYRSTFEGSSSLKMDTYKDLTTGELEALVDFHMLAAERCFEVAETGFLECMEGVSESFMCLVALEKESRRRESMRSHLRMEPRHPSFDKLNHELRAKFSVQVADMIQSLGL